MRVTCKWEGYPESENTFETEDNIGHLLSRKMILNARSGQFNMQLTTFTGFVFITFFFFKVERVCVTHIE